MLSWQWAVSQISAHCRGNGRGAIHGGIMLMYPIAKKLFLAVVLFGVAGLSASAVKAQVGMCAIQTGPLKPDLIVDPTPLKSEIYLSEEHFSGNDCAVDENCVSKPGNHLLLRFTTSTPNIGKAALVVGDPVSCQDTLFF